MTSRGTRKLCLIGVAALLVHFPAIHGFSTSSVLSTKLRQPLRLSSRRGNHLLHEKDTNEETDDENLNPVEKSAALPPPEATPKKKQFKAPPIMIEDYNLLSCDIFLLVLLSVVASWSVHEPSLQYLSLALNEASLLCVLWIVAGLYSGAFLYSAVDGHYRPDDENGGPVAAGMLGLNTMIFASNLRVILAILIYKIGLGEPEKELILLEVGSAIALMSVWRILHSRTAPRI